MRAAGADLFDVAEALTAEQWNLASAAVGWTVKDVFIHLGSLLEFLQLAIGGADVPPLGIERLNDQAVASRRDWSSEHVLAVLRDQLDSAIATFTPLQLEPVASTAIPLLDLGVYPLHAVTDMFTFDMTTHLRYDVLAPRGPVDVDAPALDETRLSPAVAWLIGGLSQMQPDLTDHLLAPISLRLTGPGERRILVEPGEGALRVSETDDADARPVATVTSTADDFLAWSTQRLPWSELVDIDGDRDIARRFLDAVNLV
ncbi:hypothetical protein MAAFP003_5380 [Mycobacterium ahvazicum]|uniref:Mycothiol-dependent maleylpyruvate isomerase metal-binding domain-containing protein n=2 Tax=Mycobacterium ahvazicum TaxID=1964395 RepID=A0A2K4YIP9_9MYCO|nr:hypothetical protein MAAFP003_5380 [Mycobacterium ahvazicum]